MPQAVDLDAQMRTHTQPILPVSCRYRGFTQTNNVFPIPLSLSLSLSLSVYPSSASPTQAPIVTQIGGRTRFMINITNSIPSDISGDLGYSTLIVRVHDLSSITQDDFTYYVLVGIVT